MATSNQLNGLLQLPEEEDGIPGISFSSGGGEVDKVDPPPRVLRKRAREQKKRDKEKLKAARDEVRKDLERGDFVHPEELSRVGLLPNGEVDKDFVLQAGGFGFGSAPGTVVDPSPYSLNDIPGMNSPSPDYPGNRPVEDVPLVPPPVKLPRLDEDGNELRDGGKTTVNPIPKRKVISPGKKPPVSPGRRKVVPVKRPSLPSSPAPARRGGSSRSTGIAVIGSVAGDVVAEIIREPLRKVIAPEVSPELVDEHGRRFDEAMNGEILTQEQIKDIADAIRERWEKDKQAWLDALGMSERERVEDEPLTEEDVNELHRRYAEEDRVESYVLQTPGESMPEVSPEISPLHSVISERSGGNGTALDDFVRIGGVSEPEGSGSGESSEDDKECSGPCNYPEQRDRAGKRCGNRAACVRKGGCRPPGGCV